MVCVLIRMPERFRQCSTKEISWNILSMGGKKMENILVFDKIRKIGIDIDYNEDGEIEYVDYIIESE